MKSVKAMLTDEKMRSVCLNLPKHISRGSAQDIKRYGSIAVILSQDIEQMMTGFQKDLFLSHWPNEFINQKSIVLSQWRS